MCLFEGTVEKGNVSALVSLRGVCCVITTILLSINESFFTEERRPILNLKIDSLIIDKGDMEDALEVLHQKDPSKILIGFEAIPRPERENEKNISLRLTNLTVGEVVSSLCKADPRYAYDVEMGAIINVFPRGAKNDKTNLLNIRVSRFAVYSQDLPGNIILHVDQWAPELRSYLKEKAAEYSRRTGIYPGSAGANMIGDKNPEFHIEVENATVREILNSIALQSASSFPTSWKYKFIIDSNASTGLGGYPRWEIF